MIVELLVALGVLTGGFLGVLGLLSSSLSLNRIVTENYIGTYLASEGMEIVRNLIDGNARQGRPFDAGVVAGEYEVDHTSFGDLVLFPNNDRFLGFDGINYNYTGAIPTNFKRTIIITPIAIGGAIREVSAVSEVTWTLRGRNFKSEIEDHFYDWRP